MAPLLALRPSYLAYLVSFATIGVVWFGHTVITEYLDHADSVFIRLNLLLLMVVSFLPFPTKLLGEFVHEPEPERIAATVYGINLFLTMIMVTVTWRYAVRAHLVRPDLANQDVKTLTRRLTPTLGVYVVVILVGLFAPFVAVVRLPGSRPVDPHPVQSHPSQVPSRMTDECCADLVGTVLSALGLTLIVMGILLSGPWGFVQPKPNAPEWFGLSPVIWLILGGGAVLALFMAWENRRVARSEGALIDPAILRNLQLRSGVTSFLFMYLVQAGLFFVVPLFLSVALGLSAIETGVRLLPLSLTLLLFAIGIPKLRPDASPRRVVNVGFVALFTGLVLLVALLEVGAGPEIVTWPLLLAGSGLGAMASQLGSVTVSAVSDEQSGEVGGLQNTGTQLGASIGTALAGAVLISALTASFFAIIHDNPEIPATLESQAQIQLADGVPFVSDTDLRAALTAANVSPATIDAVAEANADSQVQGLRAAISILALITLLALVFTRGIPTIQPGTHTKQNSQRAP